MSHHYPSTIPYVVVDPETGEEVHGEPPGLTAVNTPTPPQISPSNGGFVEHWMKNSVINKPPSLNELINRALEAQAEFSQHLGPRDTSFVGRGPDKLFHPTSAAGKAERALRTAFENLYHHDALREKRGAPGKLTYTELLTEAMRLNDILTAEAAYDPEHGNILQEPLEQPCFDSLNHENINRLRASPDDEPLPELPLPDLGQWMKMEPENNSPVSSYYSMAAPYHNLEPSPSGQTVVEIQNNAVDTKETKKKTPAKKAPARKRKGKGDDDGQSI